MSALQAVLDVALAGCALVLTAWLTRGRGTLTAAFGVAIAVTAGWLFTQTVERDLRTGLAVVLGLGAGIVAGSLPLFAAGFDGPRRPRASATVVSVTVVATLLVGGWIGANSPSETWLGPIVSHGDRNGPFGRAHVRRRPERARDARGRAHPRFVRREGHVLHRGQGARRAARHLTALLADGQLLGNHSYHHDQWRWLDPRYPELERTQATFRRRLGVCPSLYRPPHGQHTPFMSYQLARKHMTMVGWDTSATDFATTDGRLVARRILDRVRPGSIIVLHDGIDGNLTADRSVLTVALPIILRGLQARGLHAVRLDRLLGIPGYGTTHC